MLYSNFNNDPKDSIQWSNLMTIFINYFVLSKIENDTKVRISIITTLV
jgi:hypothetical protein